MKKVTLGGDRLSSGKKMTVNLHAYERSSHNRGYLWRSTMSPGTIVPFMVQVGTPGTTFDIDLDIDIMTHPTVGPLFGSFKIDAHIFQAPIRLYQALLHNNKLKIGLNMETVFLPTLSLTTELGEDIDNSNLDNTQINPSCLLAYLGIRGIGDGRGEVTAREFNAVPLLAYWDIVKNYYTNKQEEIAAYISGNNLAIIETIDTFTINGTALVEDGNPPTPIFLSAGDDIRIEFTGTQPILDQVLVRIVGIGGDQRVPVTFLSSNMTLTSPGVLDGTVTNYNGSYALTWQYATSTDVPLQPPRVVTFDIENLDQIREEILMHPGGTPWQVNSYANPPFTPLLTVSDNGRNPRMNTQEGLAVKTYQSDLFNNWLNTEWIDGAGGINERSRISTAGDFFTMDSLLMGKKIYDLLNRIGVSGGTYKDWMEATYTHINFQQTESPIYHGGLIKELVFQEVVSNSEAGTDSGSPQPLGTLAGKGVMTKKHKGGQIVVKIDEMSYIIGLISITPRLDYSQGNSWDSHLLTMDDFHKPAFDEIGFQELITEQMAWWATTWDTVTSTWQTTSAGKQPAWINYMTETNKVYGNFAMESESFMVLLRRYERADHEIADLTTYIDPVKYNFIFADTSIDAMNFWVNVAVDMTVRAKMSGKLMPNL